jgi:acetyltransferase-like isoleucine patch superfamily enzyme
MRFRRWLAVAFINWRRALRALKMGVLLPAFGRHGRHFHFDPDGFYTYHTIAVGDDVSIGRGPVLMAWKSGIIIGNKVMLGPNVTIIGGDHNTSPVGSFMFDVTLKRPTDDQAVTIDDDVWVGTGAIILKGVHVARGSIIAAGSVVTREVPPYTVVAGVPAKVISVRFDVDTIIAHEARLYEANQRLSAQYLADVLGQYLTDCSTLSQTRTSVLVNHG